MRATVHFKRPARHTLYAHFRLQTDQLDDIRDELTRAPKVERGFTIELRDRDAVVHAWIEQTIHSEARAD